MEPFIITLLIILVLICAFIAVRLLRAPADNTTTSQDAAIAAQEKSRLEIEKARLEEKLQALAASATREAAAQKESAEREMKFLKDSEERMKTQFENLANSIFEAKGKTLTEGNQTSMTALLQPLKEQLAGFRTRIDEVHKSDVEQSATLRANIQNLQLAKKKLER